MDYNRFSSSTGCHYSPEYLTELSDEELAKAICKLDILDDDLLRELVWRADIRESGLFEAYINAEEWDDAVSIVAKAAEVLNIEIDL